jgi:hypothetical protein
MSHIYLIPDWFFGIDIALEILFGIITLAVAFYSLKLYKISQEKSLRDFGFGFILISLSYILWAVLNAFVVSKAAGGLREISFENIAIIGAVGIYAHMLLLTAGFITLAYTTFRTKNSRVYYLLLGLGLLVIASSLNKIETFRILSVFVLSFIAYHYLIEWREHKGKNLFCSLAAFSLLLLSNFDFVFSQNYYQAYVIGHILEFGAYALMLRNLIKSSSAFKKNIP